MYYGHLDGWCFLILASRIRIVSAEDAEPFTFDQSVDYPEDTDSYQEEPKKQKWQLAFTDAVNEVTKQKRTDHYQEKGRTCIRQVNAQHIAL